ncbi:CoA pyrophosphatase [Telmatospirillum sp.]|uniref:CoA pyrophosphatase n=1 Tax=Telmatospirillum sp. TaxID=2079197 RepID=UPI00284F1B29|nr:CoA pyrophosphatase [Telmatospirillum sp.]MDR3437218.1 CoA pyrophosphatase [Telmatospirillum sp.]
MEYRDLLSARPAGHGDLKSDANAKGQNGDAIAAGLSRDAIARALSDKSRPGVQSDAETSRHLGEGPHVPSRPPVQDLVPAAVLIPLIRRNEGLTVLLTQRTAHLAHHPGQISFPGGRQEPEDANPTEAALRETEEEIGVPRKAVDVLGLLDVYVTITGFRIVPVVGMIVPPFTVSPDSFEVKDVFEVPLAFIFDPANHQRHSRVTPNGETRFFYALPYRDRYIWGATAAMLVNLYKTLSP